VIQTAVWQQIRSSKFKNEKKINNNFVHDYPVTDSQEEILFTDPYYGLGVLDKDGNENSLTYSHWDNLLETTDPVKKQAQLVWEWEMRTYFGLSFEQVQEMKTSW